jgi:hypothetical protein
VPPNLSLPLSLAQGARERQPGMRRGLFSVLYDGNVGTAGDGENPSASAQSR